MAEQPLPAPTNKSLSFLGVILKVLIDDLGETAAIAAGYSAAPWLKTPVISQIYEKGVKMLAVAMDETLYMSVGNGLLKFQSKERNAKYEKDFGPISAGTATPDEVQQAGDDASSLINHNR